MPLALKEAILQDSQRQETQRDLEWQIINIETKGRSLTKGEQEDTHCLPSTYTNHLHQGSVPVSDNCTTLETTYGGNNKKK
jgi:hypothetical protein